jgi:hypothetical protein
MDIKEISRVNSHRGIVKRSQFHGLSCASSGSLVLLLSDANDADMDDTSLPFFTQIFELQTAANPLTSRIVEHIRHQFPELRATNDQILHALLEERRQMWKTIEELERERPMLTPLATVSRRDPDLMGAVENEIRPLRPLLR